MKQYKLTVECRKENEKSFQETYNNTDPEHIKDMLIDCMKYKYFYSAPGYSFKRRNNYNGTETIICTYKMSDPKNTYRYTFIIPC